VWARDGVTRRAAGRRAWGIGLQDECWWRRLAQPSVQAWAGAEPLRLAALALAKGDPEPKALACYGLLRYDTGAMLLRFVEGRPVSQVTEDYLAWVCGELAREGKKALLLIWDNASWHVSQRVRAWIKEHNVRAKRDGGGRIVACPPPAKPPPLNRPNPNR